MASAADVREIMGITPLDTTITKDHILGNDKKRLKKAVQPGFQRPEGMHRELYNLLYSENKELPCPLIPTDTSKDQGYKQMRAKLGMRKVRPWKWLPFTNPARKDNLVLHHWRRQVDEGKDYPFSRFNKSIEVPTYTEVEYQHHLVSAGWTREETDHLMDLAQRFDLRFLVMHDRWDRSTFSLRSVEDIKERYYSILEKLERVHGGATGEQTKKQFAYDADHERRRKEQLRRLYNRNTEQIEEEEMLRGELRKIEARKKEREKKTADLQKLIAQADSTSGLESKKLCKKQKLGLVGRPRLEQAVIDQNGIRWPDMKSSGVSVRSQRIKLPISVGLKKTKAIECMLNELGVPIQPSCTDEICTEFNELRSEMVLLYEIKNALTTCEYEMSSLKHHYEGLVPGKTLEIPELIKTSSGSLAEGAAAAANTSEKKKSLADVIDVVGNVRDGLNINRKRKAALEQGNILKKIKKRSYQ
ncbi:DNA methyltransferase 1-associated protein 1 [Eurytemora carolleeae]|uniref:DNA methyltransferase 1-associated protein 1 n=1 Tax=Eurytemora carolleeae TaxID=1294199 RepID=UPI000C776FBC|nr:DNA methyltransferase 1-associated protein 1 [Eurytemora carolleeae]|eukprot:XP_023330940.1 DNA methyltransferase 1-associated protein 1-like [Eurytemora affinis]